MTECFACGAQFKIEFDDEEMRLNYCPNCGQETIDGIEILDTIDPSLYTEEDDDY